MKIINSDLFTLLEGVVSSYPSVKHQIGLTRVRYANINGNMEIDKKQLKLKKKKKKEK